MLGGIYRVVEGLECLADGVGLVAVFLNETASIEAGDVFLDLRYVGAKGLLDILGQSATVPDGDRRAAVVGRLADLPQRAATPC